MLRGKNISLLPETVGDAPFLEEMFSPEVRGEYSNIWPETRQMFERRLKEKGEVDRNKEGQFIIWSRDTEQRIGRVIYIWPFEIFDSLEPGWWIHPRFSGRGIATQAACILINHLFDATPIQRIQATVVVGNEASIRVTEKVGMKYEGMLRQVVWLHGRYADVNIYSILRDEWKDEQSYRRMCPEF